MNYDIVTEKNNYKGFIRGLNQSDPVIRYHGEKIHNILKKITGKDISIDFLIATYYIHYLPAPILISEHDMSSEKKVDYNLVKETYYSKIVEENRKFTVANSDVSTALTISYVENLVTELENIIKNPSSKKEKQMAKHILNKLINGGKDQSDNQGQNEEQMKENDNTSINKQNNKLEKVQYKNNTQKSILDKTIGRLFKPISEDIKDNEELNDFIKKVNDKALINAFNDAKTVRELQQIISGDGVGSGSSLTFGENIDEVIKMARTTEIQNILKLLEGLKKLGNISKRKYTKFIKGELSGYEQGSDLERIVHSELAQPDELLDLKIAESQVLLYEKRIKERLGAIYLLLDKSGSMDGIKSIWSKAVALSLYNRARRENRDFYMRFFDDTPFDLIMIRKNTKPKDAFKLIEYINRVNMVGGTDITRAITTAAHDILRGHVKGTSDIIVITDGEDYVNMNSVNKSLKEANSNLISVLVQGDNIYLRKISNHYLRVQRLDEKDLLKIVEI